MTENNDQLPLAIEHLMLGAAITDPAKFAELCAALGVDPADFADFLATDTKQQDN
jgi:hypothetical protein